MASVEDPYYYHIYFSESNHTLDIDKQYVINAAAEAKFGTKTF
jgi:hypothetical protein